LGTSLLYILSFFGLLGILLFSLNATLTCDFPQHRTLLHAHHPHFSEIGQLDMLDSPPSLAQLTHYGGMRIEGRAETSGNT
jgi:hypothetical protein